jgi:hypothetical protein
MVVNRGDTDQMTEVMTNDSSRSFLNLGNGINMGYFEPNQKLSFNVEANGCSVILAVNGFDQELEDLMTEMKNMTTDKPLSMYSNDWKILE